MAASEETDKPSSIGEGTTYLNKFQKVDKAHRSLHPN